MVGRYTWGVSKEIFDQLDVANREGRPIEAFGLFWGVRWLRISRPVWPGQEEAYEVEVERVEIVIDAIITPLAISLPGPPLANS